MSYHYLVASLPMLLFGEPPPFSSEDFLTRCAGVLHRGDLAVLAAALAGRPITGSAVADAWLRRETQLRNAVARFRATRLGVDPRGFQRDHRGYDLMVEQAVADALAQPTPLGREQDLDRARWRVAEEIALGDPFGLGTVLAFAVKLRIAERWAGLTDAVGQGRFDELLQAMTEPRDQAATGGEPV